MATERPILDALKQVFAALIPVLLQWLLKLAIPATPTPKVASRTKKASDVGNGSSGGTSVEA